MAVSVASVPSHAQSVEVRDAHEGEALGVSISSAVFTNDDDMVKVLAKAPGLEYGAVEQTTLIIFTGTAQSRKFTHLYEATFGPRGTRLVDFGAAQSRRGQRVKCNEMRAGVDYVNDISFFYVPTTCLKGGTRVKLRYLQFAPDEETWDSIPSIRDETEPANAGGGQVPTTTRWLKRV